MRKVTFPEGIKGLTLRASRKSCSFSPRVFWVLGLCPCEPWHVRACNLMCNARQCASTHESRHMAKISMMFLRNVTRSTKRPGPAYLVIQVAVSQDILPALLHFRRRLLSLSDLRTGYKCASAWHSYCSANTWHRRSNTARQTARQGIAENAHRRRKYQPSLPLPSSTRDA